MTWFFYEFVPLFASWCFAVAYLCKFWVFGRIVEILLIEDSTEQLGKALTQHFIWIKWQAGLLALLITTSAIDNTFGVQLVPQPVRSLLFLVGVACVFKVVTSGRRLIRIASTVIDIQLPPTGVP
jgi:hypothetical protein